MYMGVKMSSYSIEIGFWNHTDRFDGNYIVICKDGTLTVGEAYWSYENSRTGDSKTKERTFKTDEF